jgi:hypothetical protein
MEIQKGEPKQQGTYIAYVEMNEGFPYPEKQMLMWVNGRWGYPSSDQYFRKKVFGWIGPLPCPMVKDLV